MAFQKFMFVTGGTGMVGSRFIRDILQNTRNIVLGCLVWGNGQPIHHLISQMNAWKNPLPSHEETNSRIFAFPGDVTKPGLGMCDADLQFWSQHTDAILHFAGDIRLGKGDISFATNTEACKHVFAFVQQCQKQPSLHFMSSIASCSRSKSDPVLETLDYPLSSVLPGGYGEQKWRAEHYLAQQAEALGVPLSIYRAPFLISDCARQPWTVPDLLFQIALLTGTLPKAANYIPMHSLNTANRCIITNVLRTLRLPEKDQTLPKEVEVYHLADTRRLTWNDQVLDFRYAGLPVTSVVPLEDFQMRLQLAGETNRVARKLCGSIDLLHHIFETRFPYFDTSRTERLCRQEKACFDISNENLNIAELREAISFSREALERSLQ